MLGVRVGYVPDVFSRAVRSDRNRQTFMNVHDNVGALQYNVRTVPRRTWTFMNVGAVPI